MVQIVRFRPIARVAGISLALALIVLASERGFRTQHLLEEHYAKYGQNFGKISQDQYLKMAQQLRDSKAGKNVLEAKRSDGSMVKFDTRNGAFVSFDADGTLRTFFVPRNGVRYFKLHAANAQLPE
jgi:pyocin large subunit-like protein